MQETNNQVYLTQRGFEQLKELLARKEEEYAEVRNARQIAFELSGDGWHDNPEFNRQQQMEANYNHLVKELNERLAQAKLIKIIEGYRPTHCVGIGSWVKLTRWNLSSDESIQEFWEIVGFDETDVNLQQIAYNAPLATVIMGLKKGDISEELSLGDNRWEIEIEELYPTRQTK
ncbi:GreA/GreB family elongation factor [Moraxella sp. ZY210820]|uniref:GreA/GreB family elongation factor n=1 Tax=unclassified Moraxella TaxID=2685852 RepID=UPI002730D32B|nr:GreA/GreB family elongation factor [Moraxella sp. ZY210820]WLF84272.1 GreA/GreB family elongation factor [Moraxella sp. ZY210820]